MENMIEEEMTMAGFFEEVLNGGLYEVMTPQGWKPIKELVKKPKAHCYNIRFEDGKHLGASDDHFLLKVLPDTIDTDTTISSSWVSLKDLIVGDYIQTKDGRQKIIAKEYLGARDTYDFEVASDEHAYYSNDIVSHNTGKTTIGHIICNYAPNNTVIWITPDLIAENNGNKHAIKQLYRFADYVAPSVIVLEDLDLFTEDRDAQQGNLGLGALMNILDGVNTVKNAVTVATTNRLELIEKALSNRPGRFDTLKEVPPLDAVLRTKMFKNRLRGCEQVEDGVVEYLVAKSDDWTGAETQDFINRMNLYFINNNQEDHRIVTKKVIDTVMKSFASCRAATKKKKNVGFTE